ncbi:MAG: cell division protein ZapA [Paludibacteraceae bacterium]|nr:cell division protein ZapA [Paludibacteraceae bacterium]
MTIKVNINGIVSKLDVEEEEEKDFRDAGKMVVELIGTYRKRFGRLPEEEILTRVALDLAVNLVKNEKELAEIEEVL